jgi:hypothetical protein
MPVISNSGRPAPRRPTRRRNPAAPHEHWIPVHAATHRPVTPPQEGPRPSEQTRVGGPKQLAHESLPAVDYHHGGLGHFVANSHESRRVSAGSAAHLDATRASWSSWSASDR